MWVLLPLYKVLYISCTHMHNLIEKCVQDESVWCLFIWCTDETENYTFCYQCKVGTSFG